MPEKKKGLFKEVTKGILIENPVLRLVLGTCPTLAISTSAKNGIGMGLAATFVLIGSNLVISMLRKVIPDKVRIPAYVVIIAGFVSIVQMLMQAYLPALNEALGVYVPLIVVNCIILARAEMFANKNPVLPSLLDAIGMGIGFTTALVIMGGIRELLGNGTFFNMAVPVIREGGNIVPILIFILPPGGFFIFGVMIAVAQRLSDKLLKSEERRQLTLGCASCNACGNSAACASVNKES
ncbi:MAG: electron transport complex subunit RsxE [Saccharofermentanales bacterium]